MSPSPMIPLTDTPPLGSVDVWTSHCYATSSPSLANSPPQPHLPPPRHPPLQARLITVARRRNVTAPASPTRTAMSTSPSSTPEVKLMSRYFQCVTNGACEHCWIGGLGSTTTTASWTTPTTPPPSLTTAPTSAPGSCPARCDCSLIEDKDSEKCVPFP